MSRKIIIGSRGSKLALAQSELVCSRLVQSDPSLEVSIKVIQTLGDRKQGTAAAQQSDKKDWVIDLERALLNHEIDLAVHSGKDVPANIEAGTEIFPILKRANSSDVFIGKKKPDGTRVKFAELPSGAVVGTASLRRQSALKFYRSDLKVVEHRGNVPTRIQKLEESTTLSGIVLASAGLERLGLQEVAWEEIPKAIMLPAMNQGTLVAQTRRDDTRVAAISSALGDHETEAAYTAERACSEVLGGDCHSAISIYAACSADSLEIEARVYLNGAKDVLKDSCAGSLTQAGALGAELGRKIKAKL